MAIIKSYTDLEQSKKLAKILSCETADMTYCAITEGMREKMLIKDWQVNIGLDIAIKENLFSYRNGYMFPCWSLLALLSVLKERDDCNVLEMFTNKAQLYTITTSYYKDASCKNISIMSVNPVDACVAMIEKLNEQNLL